MTREDHELIEAWRAVANAKLAEYRRQCWRLAMLVRQDMVNKTAAVDRLWEIAIAHALVRALGEDRSQATGGEKRYARGTRRRWLASTPNSKGNSTRQAVENERSRHHHHCRRAGGQSTAANDAPRHRLHASSYPQIRGARSARRPTRLQSPSWREWNAKMMKSRRWRPT